MIYVQTDAMVAFHCIQRRGCDCERNIQIEYLTQLQNRYETYSDNV
jgi:hypothetical protein